MPGKNVYFQDEIIEQFEALSSTYPFNDFCKMAVREEIERRKQQKEAKQ